MPRIRRWFHVSHDINSDPEVWELTDRFGERAFRVWVEILSIADRYSGLVPGDNKYLSSALAGKCKTKTKVVEGILKYATDREWLVYDPVRRLRNYSKYKYIRGDKQIPPGEHSSPPPSLSFPNLNGFNSLWSLYPGTKGSKKDALKAWKEVRPPGEAIEELKAQIAHKRECDKRGVFCAPLPHVHRWIKKRRWEDEIPELPKSRAQELWDQGEREEEGTL